MSGETTGTVRVLLRLEGFCMLLAVCIAYAKLDFDWTTFALYFLVPDISLFGYFAGAKVGAISYNAARRHCLPGDRLHAAVSGHSMCWFNLVRPHRF